MNICTIVKGFLEITSLCTQNIAALGSIFGEILKMHIHLHLKSSYQFTLMRLTHYFNSSTKDKHKLETFVSQHTTWVWAREVEVWIYTEYYLRDALKLPPHGSPWETTTCLHD